jgi:hypothetical protein
MLDDSWLAVGRLVTFLTLRVGCVFLWPVSRHCYCRLGKQLPNWADDSAGKLPAYPPKPSHLLKRSQEYLKSGGAESHSLAAVIACLKCGTSPALFTEEYREGGEDVCVVSVECPNCQWPQVVDAWTWVPKASRRMRRLRSSCPSCRVTSTVCLPSAVPWRPP